MKQKIKKQWIEALRSCEYEQGYNDLRHETSEGFYYCVLGVLIDLAIEKDILPDWNEDAIDIDDFVPFKVIEWADAFSDFTLVTFGDTYDLPVTYNNKHSTLATLNDKEHLTFDELADIIESTIVP